MELIVKNTAGFCGGIRRAVKGAIDYLQERKNTIRLTEALGELVHNEEVMTSLKKQGLTVIDDIVKAKGKTVIIRAHGVSKQVYEQAQQLGIKLVDLTCVKVLKIHDMAQEYVKDGKYIFLLGETKHPEIIGTHSFCGEFVASIETIDDVEEALKQLKESKKKDVVVLAQTTFSLKKFDEIVDMIQEKLKDTDINFSFHNTICDATRLRQEETKKIAKKVELMIIIGGKNSSNTKKLYDVASEECKHTLLIQTKGDLTKEQLIGFEKIGIMAGASTPEESIQEVIEFIQNKR